MRWLQLLLIDRAYIVASEEGGGTPINPVPEPTSLLLLGSGLGMAGLAAWRRKH